MALPPGLIALAPMIPTAVNLLLNLSECLMADDQTPEEAKVALEQLWSGAGGIQEMKARVAAVELPDVGTGA